MAKPRPEQNVALPQAEADLEERVNSFNAELKRMLGKYELVLFATSAISPDGRIIAGPALRSSRPQPGENKEQGNGKKIDAAV